MTSSLVPRASSAVDQVLASTGLSKRTAREVQARLEAIRSNAIAAAAVEQARGYVTTEAVQTVAALSSLEEQMLQVAPLAEARIKHLIDQHTMASGIAIARFQG